ncbi:hypothetical protein FACS1894196_0690 [Clostridia bacterium]|nr:hypothetical protein FACS1894196_0690 [Clostridia bacterium]
MLSVYLAAPHKLRQVAARDVLARLLADDPHLQRAQRHLRFLRPQRAQVFREQSVQRQQGLILAAAALRVPDHILPVAVREGAFFPGLGGPHDLCRLLVQILALEDAQVLRKPRLHHRVHRVHLGHRAGRLKLRQQVRAQACGFQLRRVLPFQKGQNFCDDLGLQVGPHGTLRRNQRLHPGVQRVHFRLGDGLPQPLVYPQRRAVPSQSAQHPPLFPPVRDRAAPGFRMRRNVL